MISRDARQRSSVTGHEFSGRFEAVFSVIDEAGAPLGISLAAGGPARPFDAFARHRALQQRAAGGHAC
eukprot:2630987-Pyramimonas_sp.AAC.1